MLTSIFKPKSRDKNSKGFMRVANVLTKDGDWLTETQLAKRAGVSLYEIRTIMAVLSERNLVEKSCTDDEPIYRISIVGEQPN
ncbi:hypothetical protein V6R21_15840 [Limibacter armeniacum]|uniref:hypothetical protein n=1 Tax=Limibacter armeniacum TaxID=466084 RepID=UPI002FE66626